MSFRPQPEPTPYWKRDDSQGFDQIDLSPPGLNTGIARGGISGRNRKEVATILASGLDADQFASDFRLDVDLGGISLASITTYARYKGKTTIDADGTSARVFDSANSRSRSTNYSQELQLVSAEGEALEWLVGGYYFVGRTRTDNKLDLGSPLTFSTGDQRARTNAFALFGQATLNFGDRWEVTAGGRWSHERKIVQTRASQAVNGSTLAFVPFDERKSWGAFTPKLTIQHNFDNGMAYLTYARGFKSGGYNYPARNPAGVGAVLDPEILDMVELGVKGDFFDRRLRANAAAYFYDYKDLQVTRAATSGSGSVTAVTENAANARIYGLDANITWLPADRLNLTAGLNLSKSEYRDFLTTAKVFNAVATGTAVPGMRDVAFNATGHTLLRSPDWSGFFAVEYDLPLGNAGRMPINLSYSYKDDYLFDFIALPSSGRLRQKAYGLLNARVTWVSASERYRVAAWVENLADQVYFDDLVASGAGIRGSYGAPRTYGVEFSASF